MKKQCSPEPGGIGKFVLDSEKNVHKTSSKKRNSGKVISRASTTTRKS